MPSLQTVAAIATPPGTGGLAVIRLSGPGAYAVAGRLFTPKNRGRSLARTPGYTAMYGEFIWQQERIDEGIALCFRAPHSYTGEDVVELSCHGGPAVSARLLRACLQAGAAPAPAGEFTRRAVLNGRLSLTQAEAVMDLITASSQAGAAMARAALGGALHTEVAGLKQRLVALAGHLAAWTDYPEEDVPALSEGEFLHTVNEVRAQLQALLARSEQGAVLRRGVRTAIVGSPNVGKSTLFNLLTGREDAIVTPVAGTTRDVVRQQVQLSGIVLDLADTAGLHAAGDEVEREGIRRSYAELEAAGLVLAVFDSSAELSQAQRALAQKCRGRPAVAVLNKSDLGVAQNEAALAPFFGRVVTVSARAGGARPVIEEAILAVLRRREVDTDAALLANGRQLSAAAAAREALDEAAAALEAGLTLDAAGVCLDDALAALAGLLGEDAGEAVLEEVFSKFCVGK